jgi:outer membrane protein assembly factor BamE (lipoprotein component of BamABCDE complex)
MRKVVAAACAAVFCLSGCAALGRQQKERPIDPDALAQVKKGMSKEDVTRLMGAPQDIIFSNKEHDPLREHAYVFTHSTTLYTAIVLAFINFGNYDEKTDRVMVFFDGNGKVDHVGASLRAKDAAYGFPFGR